MDHHFQQLLRLATGLLLAAVSGCQQVGLVVPGLPLIDEVPAATFDAAIPLTFDASGVVRARGFLASEGDSDWFVFEAAPDTTYMVVVERGNAPGGLLPELNDPYLVMFNAEGEFLVENDDLVGLAARSALTARERGLSVIDNFQAFEYEPDNPTTFTCRGPLTGPDAAIINATGPVYVRVFISPFQERPQMGTYGLMVRRVEQTDDLIDFNVEGVFRPVSDTAADITTGDGAPGLLQLPVMDLSLSDTAFQADVADVLAGRVDLTDQMLDQLNEGKGGWRQGVVNYPLDQDSVSIFSGLELGKLYSFVVFPGHLVPTRTTTGKSLLSPILIVSDGFGTGTPGIANALQEAGPSGQPALDCTEKTTFFAVSERNLVTGDGTKPMLTYFHEDPAINVITVTVSGEDTIDTGDWRLVVLMQDSQDVSDVGQDPSSARLLTVGQPIQGAIGFIGDRDWFAFDAVGGRTYRIDLRDVLGGDGVLTLLSGDGAKPVAQADDNDIDQVEVLVWQAPTSSRMIIEVKAFSGAFQFRYVVGVEEVTP